MSDLKETQDWCAELRAENARLRGDLAAQVENDEQLAKENVKARWLLSQIITHLPTSRDWLDPDVEREARALLNQKEEQG